MKRLIIFVINAKYIPESVHGPFSHGVINYVLSVIRALPRDQYDCRILSYLRDESITAPTTYPGQVATIPTLNFCFNFTMSDLMISESLAEALEVLSQDHKNAEGYLYHQSSALIPFTPDGYHTLITHHGPFVADFEKAYGGPRTEKAYRGGAKKIRHLRQFQNRGMQLLQSRTDIKCLEISGLQRRSLINFGISPEQIFSITPPDLIDDSQNDSSHAEIQTLISGLPRRRPHGVLCFAAARLDDFKNVEMFLEASLRLLQNGYQICILIFGDQGNFFESRKQELERLVPERYRSHFSFMPRIPRPSLLSLFARLQKEMIFVCTSRFETFGFTPLEAWTRGVATVVPATLDRVETSRHIPNIFHYEYATGPLTQKLVEIIHSREDFRPSQESQSIFSTAAFLRQWRSHLELGARPLQVCDLHPTRRTVETMRSIES